MTLTIGCSSTLRRRLPIPSRQSIYEPKSARSRLRAQKADLPVGYQLKGRVLGPQMEVLCFVGDNEERWLMYYTGCSVSQDVSLYKGFPLMGNTGVATSSNGIYWIRPSIKQELSDKPSNIVLEKNMSDWWAFDTEDIAVSDVQMLFSRNVNSDDGVYWMFYSGTSEEMRDSKSVQTPFMRPGLAMSQDGLHWARIEGSHYSGSLFEVGEDTEWDADFIGRPQVLNCGNGQYRMYYFTRDRQDGIFKLGIATSTDGLQWKKQGVKFQGSCSQAFDAKGCAAQCVAYDIDNEQFVMFYEAVDDNERRSIGLAVSKNGIDQWQVYDKPVMTASDEQDAWDSGGVGAPWVVPMNQGKWRLYYSGTHTQTNRLIRSSQRYSL